MIEVEVEVEVEVDGPCGELGGRAALHAGGAAGGASGDGGHGRRTARTCGRENRGRGRRSTAAAAASYATGEARRPVVGSGGRTPVAEDGGADQARARQIEGARARDARIHKEQVPKHECQRFSAPLLEAR